MMARAAVGSLLVLLGCPLLCLGHGVDHEVFEAGTGIVARYSDQTPMAYCDVAVFAPGATDDQFQTGSTDPNGCFAFVPDTSGVWRVTVDDGMGHLLTAELSVDSLKAASSGARHGGDRLSSAVVGISVIFGLFGLYALLRASKSARATVASDRADG